MRFDFQCMGKAKKHAKIRNFEITFHTAYI